MEQFSILSAKITFGYCGMILKLTYTKQRTNKQQTNYVLLCFTQVMQGTIERVAYEYFAVCVPIVVLGAPMGSLIGSHFHRQVLAGLVYLLDTVALVTAWAIVPLNTWLIVASVLIIVVGFVFFGALTFLGHKLLEKIEERDALEESRKQAAFHSDVVLSNRNEDKSEDEKEKDDGKENQRNGSVRNAKNFESGHANHAFNEEQYTTGV